MSKKFILKNNELDYIYKINNEDKQDLNKNIKKLVNVIEKKNNQIIKQDKTKYKINYNNIENFENAKINEENSEYLIGGESTEEEKILDEYDNENYWDEECKEYNKIPHLMSKRDRIIAIGDIHGDWNLTLKCLKLAGVINQDCNNEKNAKWIGGNTVVVQIGDQIDRCRPLAGQRCKDKITMKDLNKDENSDVRIMKFFTYLDSLALKNKNESGEDDPGRVISLLGNHEILNCQKKMNYVSAKGLACYGVDNCESKMENIENMIKVGEKKRKKEFKPGNKMSKFLACSRLSAIVIGKFLFIHAGILPKFAEKIKKKFPEAKSLKNLNIIISKWLLGKLKSDDKIDGIGSIMDILTNYEMSPFWPRVLGNLKNDLPMTDEKCMKNFKPTFETLNKNIKNIVIGHTPQFYANNMGLNSTCDNKIWRIDTGSSVAFNVFDDNVNDQRKIQILEILNDGDEVNIIKEISNK